MNKLIATDNKVFKNIVTGDVLGSVLYLAKSDAPSNYEEIDAPVSEDNNEQMN